jgi:hypothetical protein
MAFSSINKLINFWRIKAPGDLNNAASLAGIQAFEEMQRVHLPLDFKHYFLQHNGLEMDHQGLRFWTLSDLKPVSSIFSGISNPTINLVLPKTFPTPDDYYVFVDVNTWSYFYAINLRKGAGNGRIVWVGEEQWWYASRTFEEFASLYLADLDNVDMIGRNSQGYVHHDK